MQTFLPIIIQLIAGAVGGNAASAAMKNLNLSKIIATITGLIGGVGGGQLADLLGLVEKMMGANAGTGAEMAGQGGAAAVGGALLTAIVGAIKKAMDKGGAPA